MRSGNIVLIITIAMLGLLTWPAHAYKPVYGIFVGGPETLKPIKTLPKSSPTMNNIVLRYGYREMEWKDRGQPATDARPGDRSPEVTVRVLVFDAKDRYNHYGPVFGAFDELGRETARAAYKGKYYLNSANVIDIRLLKTDVQENEYPIRRDGTSPGDPSRRMVSDRHFVEFLETYPATANAHEQYTQTYMEQVANVRIEIKERWPQGVSRNFPEHRVIANEIIAIMTGKLGAPPTEPSSIASPAPKEVEATHRPELTALPTRTGISGTYALIPGTDLLPAKIQLKGGKPNSSIVFHLRREGGLLKAQSKQDKFELPVRVDAQGNAEVEFFYVGAPLISAAEYEVIAMNEGKKATASVVVGLGLDFSRIRAIRGQSFVSSIYAFSLGVRSRFHPKLEVAEYLYAAEKSGVWGDRTLGIHITPEWLNRDGGSDVAYDWTTLIKPLPGGNGLVATETAKGANQPYYEAAKYAYPAVKLESTGKHIYKVEGKLAVMKSDGVVISKVIQEPAMSNQALLVMTVDPGPDSYFKMLACSLDAQDGIQGLIWEGAKAIPAAGKAFDGVQTGAGILCKLTDGDYENAFYDFANFAGGKALDRLGSQLKQNPDNYSQKVHAAYKLANRSYESLMEKKSEDERNKLVTKTLEKYHLATPQKRGEDDIDSSSATVILNGGGSSSEPASPIAGAQTASEAPDNAPSGNAEMGRALEDVKKSIQDVENDFRKLGEGLRNIFK